MITWNRNINAPCIGEIVSTETGESVLVQLDSDFPGVAGAFGFRLQSVQNPGASCYHPETDGTVNCDACGITAGAFIAAAGAFLDQANGATAEDPGYFAEVR